MKKWIFGLSLFLTAGRLAAETEFIKTLPAEEFGAAGLAKLTPAELARLEAAVLRFKAGEVAAVRQEAENKVAVAEAKAKQTDHAVVAGEKKKPGWFSALLTLKIATENSTTAEPLEGVLVGNFSGFTGGTIFTLEDGSRWVQQNRSDKLDYAPTLRSPKVKVVPASFSGFWFEVEGVGTRVRVLPYESPRAK